MQFSDSEPLSQVDPLRHTAELIFTIERSERLLEPGTWPIKSRLVWEASRHRLGETLRSAMIENSLDYAAYYKGVGRERQRIGETCHFIWSSIIRSPFLAPTRRPVLVWSHQRKQRREDGCNEDIYSSPVIQQVGSKNAVIVDPPFRGRYQSVNRLCRHAYTGGLLLVIARLLKQFLKFRRFRQIEELAIQIQPYLRQSLPAIDLCMSSFLHDRAADLWAKAFVFDLLLRRLKPKVLIVANSYGFPGLLLAAKMQSIPVVEIQHGIISNDHLGYAVPANCSREIYPDKLYIFGDYWRETVSYPAKDFEAVTTGFPYFEYRRGKIADVVKVDLLVILSQPTLRSQLEELAVRVIPKISPSIRIIFKLHPSESMVDRSVEHSHRAFNDLIRNGRLEIVKDEVDTYELLARAKWVMGGYSTAIFEAIGLGCQALLAELPGSDMMRPLVQRGCATFLDTEEPAPALETRSSACSPDSLFAQDAINLLRMALHRDVSSLFES